MIEDCSGIQFGWFSGSTLMTSGDTLLEAIQRACLWTSGDHPRITIIRNAPDGRPTITQPWAGGTWGGSCGSTCWYADPEVSIEQDRAGDSGVRMSQAWYRNGRSRDIWRGYRVECRKRYRHEGLCGLIGLEWRWAASTTEQILRSA